VTSLRYAARSLSRSPGFVAIAIAALALGLGLATTMFGVMDAVVNPYTPYRDPDAVHDVVWRLPRYTTLTPSDIHRTIRDRGVFQSLVPVSREPVPLEAPGLNRQVMAAFVPSEYFAVVGIRPVLGRVFTAADGEAVAVVGMDVWRRLYGTRRSVDGAFVTLGGAYYRVVGVLPYGATHPEGSSVWLPLETNYQVRRSFWLVGRLPDGSRYLTAAKRLGDLAAQLTERYGTRAEFGGREMITTPVFITLRPLRQRSEQLRDIHYAMVAAAALVLLIACANLGHLMSARGLAKRRELAVRMAVGAGRGTIVLQMFVECLLITAAGAALGALVAVWGGEIIANRMPTDVAWIGLVRPHLSWRVFAIGAACAGVAAFTFGLVPAIGIAMDISLDEPLKDGAGTTGRHRQRYSPLVVFEVALALVVMMAGGLLLRTVRVLSQERFGFETRNLLLGTVNVPRCSQDSTLAMCRRFLARTRSGTRSFPQVRREDLLQALDRLPDVQVAAFVGSRAPASGLITAEMSAGDSSRGFWTRTYAVVSPSYLRTVRLPIRNGRDFEPGDVTGHGVAIIDPVAADRLYPRQDPVGRMLKLGATESDAPWIRIIGVARNPGALMRGDEPLEPTLWVSAPLPRSDVQLVARAAEGFGARTAIEIRRALLAVPGVSDVRIEPYSRRREAVLTSRRFLADVFVTMGVVSLALAALGLYGVLAYAVTQRMREFAVRVAVGAQARQVVTLIIHDTLVMLLAGIGIGALVAMVATKYVDKLISGVYHTDALTLVAGELLLLLAGLVAAFVPARRAARANPLDIMRAV
jgi:predicted permease